MKRKTKAVPAAKSTRSRRLKLVRISEEMRRRSMLLGQELASWQDVTSRPMFGFDAFYRRAKIFALLPRTRALETAESVAFKLPPGKSITSKDIRTATVGGGKWLCYELHSDGAMNSALKLFQQAYNAASR